MDTPDNWMLLTLGDVGEIITGNTPSTKNKGNYGGNIPFVKPGDLDSPLPITQTEQTLSSDGAKLARLLRPGAVLVSCIGNLGKIGIAGITLATNQQINSIEFNQSLVHDRYAYQYCKTLKPWMESEASATTVTILNKGRFSQAPFPLAPLSEQKRIADKLDRLLERVDACQTRLERVPEILKCFRQSVLAAAVSGRLTEEWEGHQVRWETTQIGSVITDIRYGTAKKSVYDLKDGSPVLRIPNIGDQKIDPSDIKFAHFTPQEVESLSLKPGDLLLIRSNGSVELVGKAAVVDSESEGYLYAGYLIRLRFDLLRVAPRFISFYLASPGIRSHIELTARSTSGVNNINSEEVKAIPLELPSLDEQNEIVRRVNNLFAFADQLETRWRAAQECVTMLTPSLLAKAFRGELVEQDPNDEPAEKLLERIRMQSAAQSIDKPDRHRQPPKTRETKMTEETVKAVIAQFPEAMFSFDDLREQLPGDYEGLKSIVFNLLTESDAIITQVFDQSAQAMRFVRRMQ